MLDAESPMSSALWGSPSSTGVSTPSRPAVAPSAAMSKRKIGAISALLLLPLAAVLLSRVLADGGRIAADSAPPILPTSTQPPVWSNPFQRRTGTQFAPADVAPTPKPTVRGRQAKWRAKVAAAFAPLRRFFAAAGRMQAEVVRRLAKRLPTPRVASNAALNAH